MKFRKKPVVIEAVQITNQTFDAPHPNPEHVHGIAYDPVQRCVFIETLEGTHRGDLGDWIITGIKGEHYPCKPDIFAATYDLAADGSEVFDLVAHLHRQREFSECTFGPGARAAGVVDHIRKELVEIEANPGDVTEWVDVVLLALDGAWRAGFSPEQIAQAIAAKQSRNESRQWPDWRTAEPGKAIEHIKGEEA